MTDGIGWPHDSSASPVMENEAEEQPTTHSAYDTSSPDQHSSSHDEYVPSSTEDSLPRTPPPASVATSQSDFTTPSHRSVTDVPQSVRRSLYALYDTDACLVSCFYRNNDVAHIVRRATKPRKLTLYEYCLGCKWNSFNIDSRRNLIYLTPDWHRAFDLREWLLLPELSTMQDVKQFISSVLAARKTSFESELVDFRSKWNMGLKTSYTFMPLPRMRRDEFIFRRKIGQDGYVTFYHPYNTFPRLECYVSPPLSVINGGKKLTGLDLDALARMYHGEESSDPQVQATKERLALLREIWELIKGAARDARKWEENHRGKRPRDVFNDDVERLSQITGRQTRSSTRSKSQGGNSNPTGTRQASGGTQRKMNMGSRERDMTLTGDVLAQLGRPQKGWNTLRVRNWVEATARRLSK